MKNEIIKNVLLWIFIFLESSIVILRNHEIISREITDVLLISLILIIVISQILLFRKNKEKSSEKDDV